MLSSANLLLGQAADFGNGKVTSSRESLLYIKSYTAPMSKERLTAYAGSGLVDFSYRYWVLDGLTTVSLDGKFNVTPFVLR